MRLTHVHLRHFTPEGEADVGAGPPRRDCGGIQKQEVHVLFEGRNATKCGIASLSVKTGAVKVAGKSWKGTKLMSFLSRLTQPLCYTLRDQQLCSADHFQAPTGG